MVHVLDADLADDHKLYNERGEHREVEITS